MAGETVRQLHAFLQGLPYRSHHRGTLTTDHPSTPASSTGGFRHPYCRLQHVTVTEESPCQTVFAADALPQ
jgi:hypothetical protein